MNRMVFDKVVQDNPEELSYITLPQKEPERVPERGREMDIRIEKRLLSDCARFNDDDLLLLMPTNNLPSPLLLGLVSVPDYPFEKNRRAFIFNTLLTRPEVIAVLSKVREECNRVAEMSLFHVSFAKSLRLEDFESAQSQKHAQVNKLPPANMYTYKCSSVSSNSFCLPTGPFVSTRVMAGGYM